MFDGGAERHREQSRQSFSLRFMATVSAFVSIHFPSPLPFSSVRQRLEKSGSGDGGDGGGGGGGNSGGAWANLMSSYKELKGEFESLKRMQTSTHAAYVETASRLALVDQENGRMRAQMESMRHEHRQVGEDSSALRQQLRAKAKEVSHEYEYAFSTFRCVDSCSTSIAFRFPRIYRSVYLHVSFFSGRRAGA